MMEILKKSRKVEKVLCNIILLLLIRDRHGTVHFLQFHMKKSVNMTFAPMLTSYLNK